MPHLSQAVPDRPALHARHLPALRAHALPAHRRGKQTTRL